MKRRDEVYHLRQICFPKPDLDIETVPWCIMHWKDLSFDHLRRVANHKADINQRLRLIISHNLKLRTDAEALNELSDVSCVSIYKTVFIVITVFIAITLGFSCSTASKKVAGSARIGSPSQPLSVVEDEGGEGGAVACAEGGARR